MNSLWISYGRFCQKHPELEAEKIGKIFSYFVNSPMLSNSSFLELESIINLNFLEIKKILSDFEEENFIKLELSCPDCGTRQGNTFNSNKIFSECENCRYNINLKENIEIKNLIGRDQLSINKILFSKKYGVAANAIFEELNKEGRITYIAADVVKSQNYKIENGDNSYNEELNKMWHNIWPSSLRGANYPYLELNFTGDQSVVAFVNENDAFNVFIKFKQNIKNINFSFDFMIGFVELAAKEKAENVLRTNIHYKWDLNMLSVDLFFRVFSKFPKHEVSDSEKDKTKIFLILTKQYIESIYNLYQKSEIESFIKKEYINEKFDIKGYNMSADLIQFLIPK